MKILERAVYFALLDKSITVFEICKVPGGVLLDNQCIEKYFAQDCCTGKCPSPVEIILVERPSRTRQKLENFRNGEYRLSQLIT